MTYMQIILAGVIRRKRHDLKMRQVDLAKHLGWPLSRVTRAEGGEVHLKMEDMPDLCRVLNMTLAELLDEVPRTDLQVLGLAGPENCPAHLAPAPRPGAEPDPLT